MKILHLSDIHFGRDYESYGIKGEFGNKTKILNNLLATIKSLSEKPAHIIMTGDIAWHGKKSEFEEALIWFKQLLKVTALSSDDITLCPGNHDVHRGYVNYPDVITADNPIKELDKYYQYGVIHKMETPLENYNWFCHELGVMPYNFPQEDHYCSSYSIGYKDIGRKDVRILSFNTALFSAFADYPDDRNLIGQYQIYDLLKYGLIGKQDDKYRIYDVTAGEPVKRRGKRKDSAEAAEDAEFVEDGIDDEAAETEEAAEAVEEPTPKKRGGRRKKQ